MTALDRAIIKAFHRPASHAGPAVAEPPAAAPPSTRVPVTASPAVPLSRALAELTHLPSPSGRGAGGEGCSLPSPDQPSVGAQKVLGGAGCLQPTATEPTTVPLRPSIAALLDQAIQATTVTVDTPSQPEPTAASVTSDPPLESPPAHTIAASQVPGETAWRPLLQVDRVVWPSIQARLLSTAPAAIQQMTEGLLSLCAAGSKVLGLASCAKGEGVTTLLSAAARKLVSQGRKVAIVDANGGNPQLAQSLGLLPQIGWEETLGGGLPLEEVVIESLADGLAVLPLREPSANTIAQAQIAVSLDILAREFDVVLVDLGPLAQVADEDIFSHGVAARMDAVILVQNVRLTTPNQLADVRRRLAVSNLRYAGTIQNFVAG